jgi:hypothetical protein
MKFEKPFTIEIDPTYTQRFENDEPGCAYGKITMGYGEDWESFYMSPQVWNIEDYVKQWKLAWKHLENHDTSVFVANIQLNPLLELYVIYKINNTIYINNFLFTGTQYKKLVGKTPFTIQRSLECIPKPPKDFFSKNYDADRWIIKIIS